MLVTVVFPLNCDLLARDKNRQSEKSTIKPNNSSNKLTRCLANRNETAVQLKAIQALS